MCLIIVALQQHPEFPLIVAANRDEFLIRPTRPAAFWPENPELLAGRDLQGGGTWLGMSRQGRFAAVTNVREKHRPMHGQRSRGWLTSEFLANGTDTPAFARNVQQQGEEFAGFNLFLGDGRELWYLSNRGATPRRLTPGLYGLSNHLLDTPWPKVAESKEQLTKLLTEDRLTTDNLFELLADTTLAPDEQLPDTGVSLEWERLLSARFIKAPDYGTRCSTVILVDRTGQVRFWERSFENGPLHFQEVEYSFKLPEGRAWA